MASPDASATVMPARATPATSPLVAGGAVVAAVAGVASARVVDLPLPPCPLRSLTGLPCPGCGAGRCVTALLDGDLAAALEANALVPIAVVLIIWSALAALATRCGRQLWDPLRARGAPAVVAVAVAGFWTLRLLPWQPVAWLAA